MDKESDKAIRKLENRDQHPRVSYMEDELNAQVLDERYLEIVPWYRRMMYKFVPTEAAQIIEALIIQDNFDVVISYYERVALPLAFLQKIFRTKTPHVLLTTWLSSPEKTWFLKRVHQSLAKIITWSSNQRKYAIEELGISPAKIKLIKRGTDQKFWRPLDRKVDMISSAGMEMRDYPTLIEALRPLDVSCHIAASRSARGQIYDTVKELYNHDSIGSHVTIGSKSYYELRELYARSRFVVVPLLPTDTDNGLTVILESMAMGKPVICSKVEGQIDVIEDGVTGIYVPQGDPEALREAIMDLWNNPQKAAEMGRTAREYIEEVHSLEQFVEDIKVEVQKAANVGPIQESNYNFDQVEAEV